jgi:anti-sigma-K factor RskA
MIMQFDELEDLVTGYALNNLNAEERAKVERLLESDPQVRTMLAEWRQITGNFALLAESREMPAGSLNRLRQKAGVPVKLEKSQATFSKPANSRLFLALAAALLFFVLSALLLFLLVGANSEINRNRELLAFLAADDLKVVELQPNNATISGTVRYYADPKSNKAFLVVQNLNSLPGDKEYEAWLLTPDSKAQKAALLGSGGNTSAIFELDTRGDVDQFSVVAITVERKGGVDQPTQTPILVGQVS